MSEPLDLLILGAGCAGLSLARRLAALGDRCPRVELLEQRSEYLNDRSWCFWAHPGEPVSHQWRQVRVRWGLQSVVCDCGAAPYQMVRADFFYAQVLDEISRNSAVTLTLGTDVVGDARREGSHFRIDTTAGPRYARWVIDTRPNRVQAEGGALLWQSFVGWELETDQPVFDPAVVDLMDFEAGSPGGGDTVRFVYLLPLSTTRALIEPTVFSELPQNVEQLNTLLRSVLATRLAGVNYRLLRRESGVLPMGILQTSSSAPAGDPAASFAGSGIVYAGLGAGAARASTGYAYLRIQNWATECAARIARGRSPCPQPRDAWLQRAMDLLFLSVLREQPSLAPRLFFTLFSAVRTQRVIRFLSDRATWGDLFCIVWALPAWPFLGALWRRGWRSPHVAMRRVST